MIERWALRLASWAAARPRRVLLAAGLLLLALVPGLFRLELRTDGRALVDADDPSVALDAAVRRHFGLREPILVLLETPHPDGIYNLATLRRLEALTRALAALPGVGKEHVVSLATERRDKVYPGTLTFRFFLDPLPTTPELMAELRGDAEAVTLLRGTLISLDRKALTVLVGVPPALESGGADRTAFCRRVAAAAQPFARGGDRISVVGAPAAEALLGTHILEDLSRLLPAAIALIALALWIACRRFWALALAMLKVGGILIGTVGLMGWIGAPLRLTSAVLPVILTTMALCDEIHLLFRYQRRLAAGGSGCAVLDTFRQMARPMVLTGVTTAIGFLSLLSSPLAAVRSMGLFAGVGIAGGVLWALTVTAAALTLLGPHRLRRRQPAAEPVAAAGTFPWLRRPVPWLLLLLAVTLVGVAGIFRLRVQDSWIDGFARGSEFRQATDRANERLLGTHILLVQLTWPAPAPPSEALTDELMSLAYAYPLLHQAGPLLEPAVLEEIGRFEAFLRRQPSVGGVIGPYAELTNAAYLWLGREEQSRAIPESRERVDLLLDRYEIARGLTRRREIVDDAMRRTVVTVFLRNANFRDTARLQQAVADYARQRFAPAGVRLAYAGDVAISQSMIPKIVTTQVASLLWTVAGMFVAVLVFWRSPRIALWVLAPVSLGVIWVLGGMGWLGVPLGIATSMFCAIAIGLGDYSVHFLEEVERARAEGHPHPAGRSVELTGPSIVADTLAIGAGFLLLGFSQVPANARLGLLVASALAASCVLTLVGLAALLSVRKIDRAG